MHDYLNNNTFINYYYQPITNANITNITLLVLVNYCLRATSMSYGSMQHSLFLAYGAVHCRVQGPSFLLEVPDPTQDLAALFCILCISPAGGVRGGVEEGRKVITGNAQKRVPHSLPHSVVWNSDCPGRWKFNPVVTQQERKRHKAKMNSQSVSATVCLTITRV